MLSILFAVTWLQVGHWKDSITLWEHALRVTSNNERAHSNLATAALRHGDEEVAFAHYVEALRIQPRSYITQIRVAGLLGRQGKLEVARKHWAVAVWLFSKMDPGHDPTFAPGAGGIHIRLGIQKVLMGEPEEAVVEFEEALRFDPGSFEAQLGLGGTYLGLNKRVESIHHYREALRLQPDSARAHYKLAIALMMDGQPGEAEEHVARASAARPNHRGVRHLLQSVSSQLAETGGAPALAPEL